MEFRKVPLKRNPNCPICGDRPVIKELRDEEQIVCDLRK
jgi:adenylyltransferase/sulfurtransferase